MIIEVEFLSPLGFLSLHSLHEDGVSSVIIEIIGTWNVSTLNGVFPENFIDKYIILLSDEIYITFNPELNLSSYWSADNTSTAEHRS